MGKHLLRKPLLSRKEVAEVLGISINTVARLISRGELQTQRVGVRFVRIPAESLMAYLDKGGSK